MMKNFALIGVGGYIAVRHLKAIKETGNNLVASIDPSDSVGILDSYFPESDFFVEFERFDRHLEKLRRSGKKIDYVSICSPNYLHDAHIRFALRIGAAAICEKPLVLNPWNIDALAELQQEYGVPVYTIFQLRLHPSVMELKKKIEDSASGKKHDIDLTYITSRGRWYRISWKGDIEKSGGIATNIGVHFFDMLTWIFGDVKKNIVHLSKPYKAAGYLELEKAKVKWFLSLDFNDIPEHIRKNGMRTYRSLKLDDNEFEFSDGFSDLHTLSYEDILQGKGFRLEEAKKSISMVHFIRNATPDATQGEMHAFIKNI